MRERGRAEDADDHVLLAAPRVVRPVRRARPDVRARRGRRTCGASGRELRRSPASGRAAPRSPPASSAAAAARGSARGGRRCRRAGSRRRAGALRGASRGRARPRRSRSGRRRRRCRGSCVPPPRNAASSRAISAGVWPPSVSVRSSTGIVRRVCCALSAALWARFAAWYSASASRRVDVAEAVRASVRAAPSPAGRTPSRFAITPTIVRAFISPMPGRASRRRSRSAPSRGVRPDRCRRRRRSRSRSRRRAPACGGPCCAGKRWSAGFSRNTSSSCVRVDRRDLARVEAAEPLRQLEGRRERLLHRHLLVEHEPDQQRERALAEEGVGLGVAGEVDRARGHGADRIRSPARQPAHAAGRRLVTLRDGRARRLHARDARLVRAGVRRARRRRRRRPGPRSRPGAHVLVQAPTGSGKTLAAFLTGIDRLDASPGEGLRLLYVSPLKALNYDVERNLRGPLAGLGSTLDGRRPHGRHDQRERRQMLRTPPDILITTPESLYLLLTSQAREMLRGVETVIVDEVHAVAGTKRGAHLALSLERLARVVEQPVPAHRALGDPAAAGGDRAVRLRRPADRARRRGHAQGARPRGRRRRSRTCASRARIRASRQLVLPDGVEMASGLRVDRALDLALDLPGAARPRPAAPLDDRLRQQPPPRRAARAAAQRARRARRSRAPTTARSRASSASRSRSS